MKNLFFHFALFCGVGDGNDAKYIFFGGYLLMQQLKVRVVEIDWVRCNNESFFDVFVRALRDGFVRDGIGGVLSHLN